MIIPCTKDMIAQAKKSGKSGSIQNILSLNPNQWQVSKERTNLQNFQVFSIIIEYGI